MQLAIPALFQTNSLLDLMNETRLPVLDNLMARGRTETTPPTSLEDLLCKELAIPRQNDFPIASICLAVEEKNPGQDAWLRADPVHLRIERDKLILSEIFNLADDEARQLCEALASHFGEDFSPVITRSGAWVVRANQHADISTTALSSAIGQHIDPLLPQGADAMHWRKLLNEVQMLLFAHPVNQAREARGLPAANSLWLWGGGRLPAMPDTAANKPSVMTGQPLAQTLARFGRATLHPMQNTWSPDLNVSLMIFDMPHAALQRGDFGAWLDAMKAIEQNWLQPLFNSGLAFQLNDPIQGACLHWQSLDRWKFWRRPQKTKQPSFGFQAPGADTNAVSDVDQFGNRF